MKSSLYHIQINVSLPEVSLPFYKSLFGYFEYQIIDESSEHIGFSDGVTDFWIIATQEKYRARPYHRKQTGLNHLAFRVASVGDVDTFCDEFLGVQGIGSLYDSPKLYPEYSDEYYAVFFEDPDRIKIEVLYKE